MPVQQLGPWVGVSPKMHPHHLKGEYLTYGEDLDLSRNTLRPVRTDRRVTSVATTNQRTVYADNCCIQTYAGCEDYAIDPNGCERVFRGATATSATPQTATPDANCNGNLTTWGWPCDFNPPSVTYVSPLASDRVAEPRSYVYTYINVYGEESHASAPSPVVIMDYSVSATITGFAVLPAAYGATSINIYVLVAGLSSVVGGGTEGNDEYLKIATLPIAQLMFTHNPQVHPLGDALTTDEFVPVPADAADPWYFDATQVAFRSQGALRFTEPWNYSLAPLKYAYKPQEELLRIAATQKYVYLLTCGRPEVVTAVAAGDMTGARESSIVNDSFPLIGRRSVAVNEDSVIFASVMGLVRLNGPNASTVTDEIFTQHQWDTLQPHTMIGIVYQGYYYGATATTCFRLEMPRGPKANHAEKFSYLSIRPTGWTVTSDDRLLYSDATGLHELGQGAGFKTYTAVTKDIMESDQRVHTVARVVSAPGTIEVTQTAIVDNGREFEETRTLRGGINRFSRRLAAGVRYTIKGKTEVTAFVVGNSVAAVTSR